MACVTHMACACQEASRELRMARLRELTARAVEEKFGPSGDYARGYNAALREVVWVLDGDPTLAAFRSRPEVHTGPLADLAAVEPASEVDCG